MGGAGGRTGGVVGVMSLLSFIFQGEFLTTQILRTIDVAPSAPEFVQQFTAHQLSSREERQRAVLLAGFKSLLVGNESRNKAQRSREISQTTKLT